MPTRRRNPTQSLSRIARAALLALGTPARVVRHALAARRGTARIKDRPALIVLAYHEVTPDLDHPLQYSGTGIHPRDFHTHLTWCAARFAFVRLHEGIARLRAGTLDSTCVAVTFDDGHHSIADHAYPILKELSVPATLFLSAPFLDNRDHSWLFKALYLFRSGEEKALRELFDCSEPNLLSHLRRAARQHVYDHLDRLAGLFERSVPEDKPAWYISRGFLERDDGRLLDVANHSLHHYRLSWLHYAEQLSEIKQNHQALQRFPNVRPLFAVPFGSPSDWNDDTLRACAAMQLEFISLHGGVNRLGRTGVEIHRFGADRIPARRFSKDFYRNALNS